MRILNEKGKLFGIINVIDLIILLAIVFAISAVGWKMLSSNVVSVVDPNVETTVVLRVRGAMPYLVSEIQKKALNQKLISGNDYVDAKVTDIKVVPSVYSITAADGSIVKSIDPMKQDVMITVKTKASKTSPIIKIGAQEMRAGRDFTFKTKYIEVIANIETVNING